MSHPTQSPSCPHCRARNPRWLEFASSRTNQDSYQCLSCGQTWTQANHATVERPAPRRPRHTTITSRPTIPAPRLVCPRCDQVLIYRESIFGGTSPPERWDRYSCIKCGAFEYRERTRKLTHVGPTDVLQPPTRPNRQM